MMTADDRISQSQSASEDGSYFPRSTHPYLRRLMKSAIFARCHLVAKPQMGVETYIPSLSMLGHGIALWEPLGSTSRQRKKKHLKTGINIGDVGYLGRDGNFLYLFNIFSSPTDDVQVECPPDLEPLPPLDPKDITKNELYFPPGTALVSKGVTTSHLGSSPLDMEFTIDARQSGILVLPDGASRENLVSTDLVRDFVRKNALAWYMFVNKYSFPSCPNGHLYVITGCDKTATYALATTSSSCLRYSETPPTVRYHDGKWKGHEKYHIVAFKSNASFHADQCAVIIRGMQVALSASDWMNYIFRNEPQHQLFFYYIPSVPVLGPRAKRQTKKEKHSKFTEKRPSGALCEVIFNPSVAILHLLIQECPKASVAIAEDRQWCSLTEDSDGSVGQIVRILRKMLEENEIHEENGLATLVPMRRTLEGSGMSAFSRSNVLLRAIKGRHRRLSMAMKLAKIFPGQGLPNNMLS